MRLAQIVPQIGVPAGSGVRMAPESASPLAAGLAGLSDVSTAVAGAAGRAADLRARAEEKLRQYEQAAEANHIVREALDQLGQFETVAQHGTRNPQTDELEQAPLEPTEYMPTWLATRDTLREKALARTKDPMSRVVVGKMLETAMGPRQDRAQLFADNLRSARIETRLDVNLARLEQDAILDPELRTPDGAPVWGAMAERALASAVGAVPEARLREKRRAFFERVDIATARRQGEIDPEAAIKDLETGKYSRIEQGKADQLAKGIGETWDRKIRQQDAAERAAQGRIEKEQTTIYNQHTSDLYADAVDGRATLDQLEQWRRQHRGRAGVDEDFTRIRKAILDPVKPEKEWKSDPATRARVISAVEPIVPTITARELERLNEQRLLDNDDLKYGLARLRSAKEHQRGLGETEEGRARTEASKRHAQAEQELRVAILGPESFLKGFDDKQERIYGQALVQLRTRSSAYGGKEDPLAAKDAMLPGFLKAAGRQTLMKAEEARVGLTFPSEMELSAARQAGRITEGHYREQQERWNIINQAKKDLESNAAAGGDDAAKALEKLRGGGKGAKPAPTGPAKPAPKRGSAVEPTP